MKDIRLTLNGILKNVKADKKSLAILAVALVGIILIVISSASESETKKGETEAVKDAGFSEAEYTLQLEKRLEEMISAMYGAGRTKVAVTLECDYETVYAKDGSFSKDENSSDEKNEYIIIDSTEQEDGLVLKTVTPRVRGVAVLCEGGNDPQVQAQINQLLSALLNLGSNHISVSRIQ